MLSGVRFGGEPVFFVGPLLENCGPVQILLQGEKKWHPDPHAVRTAARRMPALGFATGIKPGPHAHKQPATPKHMVQLYMALNYLRSI